MAQLEPYNEWINLQNLQEVKRTFVTEAVAVAANTDVRRGARGVDQLLHVRLHLLGDINLPEQETIGIIVDFNWSK